MLLTVCTLPAYASNPPPTQLFYVPFPEDQQLAAFDTINSVANDPITVFITLSAATDGTVIYYDHWEDGYERDITNPVQSTTQIFGDGNPANGYPPGNAADLISAGTVFNLRNFITTSTLQSVMDYDARDKIASFKPISVTKMAFPDGTDTLLAGCVEVFEYGLWGNEYRSPVGVDMPTSVAAGNLTYDENVFNYAAMAISAGPGGASVQIDKDNDGIFEETVVLAEGGTVFRDSVNVGGRVLADKPIQVILFTGTLNSNYASRDTSLLPVYRWSSDYYAPVSTRISPTDGTVTYLYNPSAAAITVNYDYRSSSTAYTTASISVPAGGNARVLMTPSNGTTNFGAYRFYTTGPNPPLFYAISAIDADAASGSNQNWDGGFTLVGKPSLTTQVLVSLGIGRDPYSATNPGENGNPVWVTTVGNNHTQERVYVDYNGDNAGPLTDPNGNKYDVAQDLRELEQYKIFDPDGDQSGMLVYTLNPTVKIAAVWGQDPSAASVAQPGLDVASLVPPLREGNAGKKSNLSVDADGDGFVSAGDTLEYDIRAVSDARTNIPGPFGFIDNLPSDVTYVPGTTRYRFTVSGAWQAWVSVPDNGSGTPFPLDGAGFAVPGNIGSSQQIQMVFKGVLDTYANLSAPTITNTGTVEISPYGLVIPVNWTDILYGTIGDRVWNDLDGDGVQDTGETGINGVRVYADLNNNGIRDTTEPSSTTDSVGNYLLKGLTAGTYTVRVTPADIAAANVGYGPTYDLDGIATSYVATVVLAGAQDRVDVDFGYRVGASVGDRVWMDRDGDGVQEAGEPGVNGVRVYIDSNSNGSYDSGEPNTLTSGDGSYYIGNLAAGTLAVRIDASTLPVGAAQTFDLDGIGTANRANVTLIGAEHRADLDFGYRGDWSIGDLVWEDLDGNGSNVTSSTTTYTVINGRVDLNNDSAADNNDDGFIGTMRIINGYADIDNDNSNPVDNDDDGSFLGISIVNGGFDITNSNGITNADDGTASSTVNGTESGIANIRVYIDSNGNGTFDTIEPSATTNASGVYSIGNLFDGTFIVKVDTTTLPTSYAQTYDLVSPTNDHTATVTLTGASRTDVDFGYRNDASIGDLVWNDRNANGARDGGESGIEGVLVYIDADNDNLFDQGVERFSITDINGYYLIPNLAAGSYNIRVEFSTLPQGTTQTYDLTSGTLDHEASRTLAVSENATDVDFGYRASASVGDFIWNDIDADGIQDTGEAGISGVRVYLDINGNDAFDSASEPAALTDSAGAYLIGNLVPGTYNARVDTSTLPAGRVQTFDANGALDHSATFSLAAAQARSDIDFGYVVPVSIGDLVWSDLNANGQQDSGETGISGVTVTAYNASNDTIAGTTISNASGAYSFANLMPGTYYVVFDRPSGYNATPADRGADATDSDADTVSGRTPNVTLTGGQSHLTLDAGFYQPVSIGDFVWNDVNANGQQDSGEIGITGVTVTLYRPGFGPDGIVGNADDATAVTTTTSNASGAYSFTSLPPGTYQVGFGTLSGYNRTLADQGVDATDSDANASTGLTATFALTAGQTNNTFDAGYYQPVSIGDFVWNDVNANGQQDSGETGLSGVTVSLYRPGFGADGIAGNADDATVITTATTISGGAYNFAGLRPGTYQIGFSTLSGYNRTLADQGADATDSDANAGTGLTTTFALTPGQTNNTLDAGYYQPGSITGTVFADLDNNDTGDTAIAGVTLILKNSSGNDIDSDPNIAGVQPTTAITNASGVYTFGNLVPGSYRVVQTQPSGYLSVSDVDGTNNNIIGDQTPIIVGAGQTVTGRNFIEEQPATVTGHLYIDTNGNGVQDGGEPNLANVDIVITGSNAVNQTVTTDASGNWTVSVPPGTTTSDVQETDPQYPTGYTQTQGNDPTTVNALTGVSTNGGIDGYFLPGSITGSVLADTNNDNSGDAPISGVTLTLVDSSGNPIDGIPNIAGVQPVTTTSAVNGSYTFGNLPPGTYGVVETQPVGYNSVSDKDGGNPNEIRPIAVTAGNTNTANNFIEEQPGSLSGTVRVDTDGDGDGDVTLSGVVIHLLDNLGLPVLDGFGAPVKVTTLGVGTYSFGGLTPGSYRVRQDQPSNYNSVSDTDGTNNNRIGDETPIVVSAGNNSGGNDFIEIELGVISGFVLLDTDNNGSGDSSLPGVVLNLLDALGNPVLDGFGNPIQATSGAGGFYSFTLVQVGSYRVSQNQPAGCGSVSDVDGANNNLIGDQAPLLMTPGLVIPNRNFVEIELGSIAGTVRRDSDNNGTGEAPLPGVTLTLLDGSGNPVDGDPGTAGIQPVTCFTDVDGNYLFGSLLPGTYQISETQPSGYASVSDVDGGDPNRIGNIAALAVTPGQDVTGRDFVEVQLGSISGFVYAGATPLGGITLTLLNADGTSVDGDAITPGVQPITTVTDSNGRYTFTGVVPGDYRVAQTQPFGYNSSSDRDGGDLNIIGDVFRITVLPGQENANNNFAETLDTCPDTWAEWKFQNPGHPAFGNPDDDALDNLNEFAFAKPATSGAGDAWRIQPSVSAPGTIEGVFTRPKGAWQSVTYSLEHSNGLSNSIVWSSIEIISAMYDVVDNGDCTETITIRDLETLTGMPDGKGFVRIRADLDEENDLIIDHTSYIEVEGWQETALGLCCRTYANPFLRSTVFNGTIDGVIGQTLNLTTSAGAVDLGTLLAPGVSYYAEVTVGANDGQRFDIISASGSSITLANDSNLHAAGAPFNTLTGALPVSLAGDQIVVRRHWTLAEMFPPSGFGATDDRNTADQVQLFSNGQWKIFWLYDDGTLPIRWVKTGDNTYANQGASIIPPGQGLFFNNRTAVTSILAYGEVRENDFVRPIAQGSNLVAGGYPIDQSPASLDGRAMTVSAGFFGSRDIATADTFYLWDGDITPGSGGYSSYFLNNNAPRLPSVIKWVKVGDASLLTRNSEVLFKGNASVFLRSKDGLNSYIVPTPWTP